jgi:hypothetical protein
MIKPDLYEPCPDCGKQAFRQSVKQYENVNLDENGEPEEFVPVDHEVVAIFCTNCDKKLDR